MLTAHLTDGKTLGRDKILLVLHDTVISSENNVIKAATKEHKDKVLLKGENMKETDVIAGGRGAMSDRYLEGNA